MRGQGRRNHVPHYPADPKALPSVAILGRPNVGKSTLFNRLVGRTAAIVQDQPGITRDRLYAEADIIDKRIALVDTGGWEYSPENDTESGINQQCRAALKEATLVLFVVDGRNPLTNGDYLTADWLRKDNRPTLLVVNKIDSDRHELEAAQAYELGMDPLVMISAAHGRNVGELEDLIYERLPQSAVITDGSSASQAQEEEYATRVAVIGRPNAGKSSLINALIEEDRLLTMDRPGTTRDAVDIYFHRGDREYVFADTAGIRRKAKVDKQSAEHLAVSAAVNAIHRCRVVVLLIDANGEVAEQDAKILGLAVDRGRAVVAALNKWDLLKNAKSRQIEIQKQLKKKLAFAPWIKTVKLSALTGYGLDHLLDNIDEAATQFNKRVPTSQLNALFKDIIDHHPPPLRKGRPVKLFYATQAKVRPPTFVIQTSYPEALHFSYIRYIENRIRETFGFDGSPVKLVFRKRVRKGDRK